MKWIGNTGARSEDFWLYETEAGKEGLIRFGPIQGWPEDRTHPPDRIFGVYVLERDDEEKLGYTKNINSYTLQKKLSAVQQIDKEVMTPEGLQSIDRELNQIDRQVNEMEVLKDLIKRKSDIMIRQMELDIMRGEKQTVVPYDTVRQITDWKRDQNIIEDLEHYAKGKE